MLASRTAVLFVGVVAAVVDVIAFFGGFNTPLSIGTAELIQTASHPVIATLFVFAVSTVKVAIATLFFRYARIGRLRPTKEIVLLALSICCKRITFFM